MNDDTVKYVVDLAKKNSLALSFIPRPRLEEYHQKGQILMSFENGDPCGFLVLGAGQETTRIYQACIQYDARRREHGLDLVARTIAEAKRRGSSAISLWCADDLEANAFWEAAGFTFAGQREGGQGRSGGHGA